MTWEECIRYEFKKNYNQAKKDAGGSIATMESDPVKVIELYVKRMFLSNEEIERWMIDNSPNMLEGLKEAMDELSDLFQMMYIRCEEKCTKGNHTNNSL